MKAYGKSWNYNVYGCQYCTFWKGRKKGCVFSLRSCCCPVPQKPPLRFGIPIRYCEPKPAVLPKSECDGCPYGRDSPCIGWCTKEVMKAVGLPREMVV